ncbi:NUDIX hydrolase domain-like protein [Dactylonectria estremocensis]|uniref:NUDIX hydrolase domain-like protein n=1 Tax=Dactylonectria estremocensis TaxID=1079267 RepID=A0A9P9J6L0_9HYPO|nr:NUDIX hydrolase domain-like protein [Dactylonectria estremocensis]
MADQPPKSYTVSPALQAHADLTPAALLASQNGDISHLIAGALVTDAQGRALLLRRAPTDSWPLKWEVPGGCVDATDASLVAAAVRELWEETGLRAVHVRAPVRLLSSERADAGHDPAETDLRMKGDLCLFRETGNVWAKLTAWVDVEATEPVVVRADEHAEWAWVSEPEARTRRFADGRELDFVSEGVRQTVLEGFRLWGEAQR